MTRDRPVTFREMLEDEGRFRAWYADALPRVYRYLYSRCGGDVGLAEELTQEASSPPCVDRTDGTVGRTS